MKVMLLDVSAEVPPPYMPPGVPGLVTVTAAVPGLAVSESGIVVVRSAALWAVGSAVPFQLMVALLLKLVPLTVRGCITAPWVVLVGVSWVMVGVLPATMGVVACLL